MKLQTLGPRPNLRRLRCEPLEDRRLLSITVNTLIDEADGSIVDSDVSLRDALASSIGSVLEEATGLTEVNASMISLFSLLPPVQHLVPAVGRTKVNEPSIALESSPPDLFDDLVLDADHDGCELEAFEAVFDDLQEVIASR